MINLPAKEIASYEKKLRQTGNDLIARKAFELFKITRSEQCRRIVDARMIPVLHQNAVMKELDPFYYPDHELIMVSEGFLNLGTAIIED